MSAFTRWRDSKHILLSYAGPLSYFILIERNLQPPARFDDVRTLLRHCIGEPDVLRKPLAA